MAKKSSWQTVKQTPGNPMEICQKQTGAVTARAAGGQELEESAMAKSQMTVISTSFKVVFWGEPNRQVFKWLLVYV